MFLKERQAQISRIIKADGRVAVTDLAKRFGVTEDCIRKDLKTLADQGICRRVYGGAISVSELPERSVFKRISTNVAEKRIIASKAYAQIADADTVFLDISTTNLCLATLLAEGDKHCIVVSNMIDVLQTLAKNQNLSVLSTGGNVNLEVNGFVGAMTVSTLEPMFFDKAFLGTLGIDLNDGSLTTFDLDDGLIKRRVIQNSTKSYVVADASKFKNRGHYQFGTVNQLEAVITDTGESKVRASLEELGTRCI